MSSTTSQVNANFTAYVGVYITTQTSESIDIVIIKVNNQTYTYTVGQDSSGNLFVDTWNVGTTTAPTFSNLQSMAPSSVIPYIQSILIYNYFFQYPNAFNIIQDIYNTAGKTFTNQTAMLDYLAGLMVVSI